MISIVNYGVSNVGSMLSMLRKIGVPAEVVSSVEAIDRAEKIILPGVGAFDHGVAAMNQLGIVEVVRRRATDGVPFLGVCLGMQMLADSSEEGTLPGLGLIPGRCVRFRSDSEHRIKVPHMGWEELVACKESPILAGLEEARFYFVHSYHFVCSEGGDELARARHGIEFTAAVQRKKIWGVQFHPEKSHKFGMTLLRNFAAL